MLPWLLKNQVVLNDDERRWRTIKEITFFQNGLVDDIHFYKELKNNRGYIVTKNENIGFSLPEIFISDFLTLNEREWLSGFVVDHCLFIYNSEEKYQIISQMKSTIIFDENSNLTQHFVDSINFNKNCIIMPVLIQNHFILIQINILQKEMVVLDPYGNEFLGKNRLLKRFSQFLYLRQENVDNWEFTTVEHIKQVDSFNCGVFIIYFFSKIVKNEPLTDYIDINHFRRNLKWLLLKYSDDMKNKCLFCSLECTTTNESVFNCESCKRPIHEKCVRTISEIKQGISMQQKLINGICELCKLN